MTWLGNPRTYRSGIDDAEIFVQCRYIRGGATSGYKTFGDYGNAILYRKYGRTADTPIIHRAMYYVEAGEPMWDGGPIAPYAGYITKGDNKMTNMQYDQYNLCTEPVHEEWIDGVACSHVPYILILRSMC